MFGDLRYFTFEHAHSDWVSFFGKVFDMTGGTIGGLDSPISLINIELPPLINTEPLEPGDRWRPIYDPEKNGDIPANGGILPPILSPPIPSRRPPGIPSPIEPPVN